jgi:hypothetical protein
VAIKFGPILQNGYVVRNLERAVEHWAGTIGVGPFFLLEHIQFGDVFFRGRPLNIDMSVAVGYWHDVQIELIVQHDTNTSIYTEFAQHAGEGLQHLGVMVDALDPELERLSKLGVKPVQWGATASGIRFAYVNTDVHAGAMIELIESGPAINAFFGMAREAARDWDGSKPLRRLG